MYLPNKKIIIFSFIFIISTILLFIGLNIKNESKNNLKKPNPLGCYVKVEGSRCTGSAYCRACSNCSRCKYCNNGGSCGVCSRANRNMKSKRKQKKIDYPKPSTSKRNIYDGINNNIITTNLNNNKRK